MRFAEVLFPMQGLVRQPIIHDATFTSEKNVPLCQKFGSDRCQGKREREFHILTLEGRKVRRKYARLTHNSASNKKLPSGPFLSVRETLCHFPVVS